MRNRVCAGGCNYFREGRCMLENIRSGKKPQCPMEDGTHGVAL